MEAFQLTGHEIQSFLALQCRVADAVQVRYVFALGTPMAPLALLGSCLLLEFCARGMGALATSKASLNYDYIGRGVLSFYGISADCAGDRGGLVERLCWGYGYTRPMAPLDPTKGDGPMMPCQADSAKRSTSHEAEPMHPPGTSGAFCSSRIHGG